MRPRGRRAPARGDFTSLVRPGHPVAVDVHRHLDRVVAELVLHGDHGLAVLKQPRGEGVAEIVEADPPSLIATRLHDHAVIRKILAYLGLAPSGSSPGRAPPEPGAGGP